MAVVRFKMVSAAGAALTGLTPTVTVDGAASAGTTAEVAGGWYAYTLHATEATAIRTIKATGTLAVAVEVVWEPVTVTTNNDKTGYALTASYNAAKYATQSTVWTDAKAAYLNASIDSRAAASTALSSAVWTSAKAGYITGTLALSSALTTVSGKVDAVDTVADAIKAKTDNLPSDPADASVVAGLIAALPTAAQNADAVWDEAIAGHVTAGTAGRFLQRIYRYFFNKRTHTNSAVTVYADDGTTADATMTVTGDTTTVTKAAPS